MIQEYRINGISGTWLHQPGMMVYVETEYNEEVNRVIKRYHREIGTWCKANGLIFLYIPEFYKAGSWNWVSYVVGRDMWNLPSESTSIVLKHSLGEASFSQIKGASFLFTSDKEDSVSAYPIDAKEIEKSIVDVLSHFQENSMSAIERELFNDSLDALRTAFREGKMMDDRIKKSRDENEMKCRFRVSARFACWMDKILDEDEEECRVIRQERKEDVLDKLKVEKGDFKEQSRRDTCTGQRLFTTELTEERVIERNDVIDTTLLKEAQTAIAKLLDMGYSKETIWALLVPMQELSPIHVTKDYSITLPLYRKEIKLPPVQHAIYLLFLKHPEGIYFKNLPDYEEELYFLYRKLAFRGANVRHIQTIKDLVNPLSNSMNEKCSNIKKRVLAILDDSLAKHYYISGGKGELKRIDIKPEMIVWE